MTVVYDTSEAQAVGNVTAQLFNSNSGFVPVGPLLSVPAHEDGSWSIELTPNDASVGFSSIWYVTMHQENVPPTSWHLNVPADGPVFVGALDYSEAPNQGINVEAIQAGSGISIDPPDGTGIVTITNTGGGGGGGLPVYSGDVGVSITDNSATGITISEQAIAEVLIESVGTAKLLSSSDNARVYSTVGYVQLLAGQAVEFIAPTQAVQFYTADNATNLNGTPAPPAIGYTATDLPFAGGAVNGAPAQFVWNSTFSQWQPVPQNIGNVTVQTYNRGTALFTNLEVCPWYNAQPVGLVSTAGPWGADIYPFATLSAGDNIAVQFNSLLQLLAAGSVAVPGWDYVDIAGTVTVWDAAGTNLLEASFSANQIRSDTATSDVTFTQVRIVGSDLALATVNVTDDSIQTTAGGAYNISTNVYASWD